jgi:hypothetical protein
MTRNSVMMKIVIVLAATLPQARPAHAAESAVFILQRCSENDLDKEHGKRRNAWAKHCFPDKREAIDKFEKDGFYALVHNKKTDSWNGPLAGRTTNFFGIPSFHHLLTMPSCQDWELIAYCVFSCYTPEQRVLFEEGYVPIVEATERLVSSVVTLRSDSRLEELSYQSLPVESYSRSFRDASEVVRTFELASGGRLRVTLNHPMVTAEGMVKPANEVDVGESLVKQDGSFDPIVRTRDELFFGKVYNVAPASSDPIENIVVAEGYLNGSSKYQYQQAFVDVYYRKMLRETIDL